MATHKNKKAEENLSDKDRHMIATCADLVEDALEAIKSIQAKTRDFALVRTKLEEAEMWLDRGFENLGYSFITDEEDEEDEDNEF